ncbi:MAG TPA: nuclear transport factor 2 family protein [Egibacteraceae bacterium]|nr:nuclear transport factor 2 family protein [Egibacteraceae bacterium]
MDADAAARLAEAFAEAWARPSLAAFRPLLADDVRLSAPFMDDTAGVEEGLGELARLLRLWPDVRGEVHRWGATADGVLIEWTMRGRLGRADVAVPAVDRIVIRDGLIAERVAYFDTLPLLAAALRQPRLWPAVLRSGLGPSARLRRAARRRA